MKKNLELQLTLVAPAGRQEIRPLRAPEGFTLPAAPPVQRVRIPIQFSKPVNQRVTVSVAAASPTANPFAKPCL